MSLLADLIVGVIEASAKAVQRETERAAKRMIEGVNRRLGPVPKGRAPIDAKFDKARADAAKAKQRLVTELDEFEPAMPSIDDQGEHSGR